MVLYFLLPPPHPLHSQYSSCVLFSETKTVAFEAAGLLQALVLPCRETGSKRVVLDLNSSQGRAPVTSLNYISKTQCECSVLSPLHHLAKLKKKQGVNYSLERFLNPISRDKLINKKLITVKITQLSKLFKGTLCSLLFYY